MPTILTETELDHFVSEGYVHLRGAFPRGVAAEVRAFLWHHIGLSPQQPEAWPGNMLHLQESFTQAPFSEAFTPRLLAAYDDVLGAGRWIANGHLGWWPISFPGFETGSWQPPEHGWHVDGSWFHHHLTSPEQGLLPLFIFSDIEPGDGGTAFVPGSHRQVARLLAAAEPAGLDVAALGQATDTVSRAGAREATGHAGDVILLHPFMLHARSMNTGGSVRFICNPGILLHQPMQLQREDCAYSAVERAIVQALQAQPANA